MKYIKKTIINHFNCSWAEEKPSDILRQLRIAVSFSTIGMFFLLSIGIINIITGNILLGAMDILFFLLLVVINIYLRKSFNVKLGIIVCTILYFSFSIYLMLQETITYSGILLWLFIYPPIVIFLSSKKIGLSLSLICMLAIALVLFDNRLLNILPTSYSLRFSMRFLLVYLTFTFFAYSYEMVRLKLEKELKVTNEKLAQLAITDPLTELSNRRDIIEKIEYEKNRSLRYNSSFSIVLADIDNFKEINDKYGHNCGDYILKELAGIIKNLLRKQDSSGRIKKKINDSSFATSRWGGEEFLMLLPETDVKGSSIVAEKLRVKIEKHSFYFDNHKIRITMSFGVSEFRDAENIDKCIARADKKLYEAKNSGRNLVMF